MKLSLKKRLFFACYYEFYYFFLSAKSRIKANLNNAICCAATILQALITQAVGNIRQYRIMLPNIVFVWMDTNTHGLIVI